MNNALSNEYASLWIEDGILNFIYHPSVVIDITVAEKVVKDRLKWQAEKTYPIFCDTRGIKDMDKAARDYLANEGSLLASAVAFLVNPPISQTIIDFYVKTNKPLCPTRIFLEKYDALQFLKPYRN